MKLSHPRRTQVSVNAIELIGFLAVLAGVAWLLWYSPLSRGEDGSGRSATNDAAGAPPPANAEVREQERVAAPPLG